MGRLPPARHRLDACGESPSPCLRRVASALRPAHDLAPVRHIEAITPTPPHPEPPPRPTPSTAGIIRRPSAAPHPLPSRPRRLKPPPCIVIAPRPCLRRCLAPLARSPARTRSTNPKASSASSTTSDLDDRIAQHLLVPVPASASLLVNGSLPDNRRYCRSWTAHFLTDFARAHAARFHRPILVSSAVRTVEFQKQLILINGNAAAAEGDVVSPHLTGATIDIAKGTMSRQEVGWVRSWLLPLQLAGKDRRRGGVPAGLLPHHGLQDLCPAAAPSQPASPASPRRSPGRAGLPRPLTLQFPRSHECDSHNAGLGYNRGQTHFTSKIERRPGTECVCQRDRIQNCWLRAMQNALCAVCSHVLNQSPERHT